MFGKKSVLNFFNLKRIPLSGSLDSVWKAHFNLSNDEDPYKVVAGAVVRFAIDMKNMNSARYSIDTGISGWPLSPHYGDIFEKWKKGSLIKMYYQWEKIRAKYKNRNLTLTKNKS